MANNTIIRVPQPKFGINEIVYFRESALLGYLEPAKVRDIGYNSDVGKTFYVFEFKKSSPNTQIAGDAIDLKMARRIVIYEDEILSYNEAVQLKITFLENELNKTKLLLESDLGSPEIDIIGDNATSLLDFGSVQVGGYIRREFNLLNSGTSDLIIFGNPVIEIAGDNDFSVYKQPSDMIKPGEYSSFMIQFSPESVGRRVGIIQIMSNDSTKSLFSVSVEGIGS